MRLIDADALYTDLVKMNDFGKLSAIKAIVEVAKAPTIEVEPKWIPVSKEQPKGGSNVLVCFDFKGDRTVEMATYYSCGKFIGFNDEYLTKEGRKYRKAIAWMEKPKPYEVEE